MNVDAGLAAGRSPSGGAPALRAFVLVAVAAYALHLLDAVLADRALFADGAQFFADLMAGPERWAVADDSKHIRLLVNAVNQWPAIVARVFGVESPAILRALFGAGLFIQPLLIYGYCVVLSRRAGDYRVLTFAAIGVVVCVLPSEIFAVNPAITALALAWVAFHYLLLDLRLHWYDYAAMLIVTVVLFRAHEAMAIWGGLIALLAGWRLITLRDRPGNRAHLYALGAAGLAQSLYVFRWQATHAVGEQTDAFLTQLDLLRPSEMWVAGQTRIALLTAAGLAVLVVYEAAVRLRPRTLPVQTGHWLKLVCLVISATVVAIGGSALLTDAGLAPYREFQYRVLIPFGSAALMCLAGVVVVGRLRLSDRTARLAAVTLASGLLGSTLWQAGTTHRWRQYVAGTRATLAVTGDPWIDPAVVEANLVSRGTPLAWRLQWPWAWPVFSVSLHDEPVITAIVRPVPGSGTVSVSAAPGETLTVPYVTFQPGGLWDFRPWLERVRAGMPPTPPVSPAR